MMQCFWQRQYYKYKLEMDCNKIYAARPQWAELRPASVLRGRGDDVGSLPGLVHVQANQTDVLVHRPLQHQHWPLQDGCGAPVSLKSTWARRMQSFQITKCCKSKF